MVIRQSQETGKSLLAAARSEFAQHGFAGTDSNKIARAAGFAPQTFYRWFRDKTEIFIAVYRSWEEEERAMLEALQGASSRKLADAIVAHHREHLMFRRSLRQLAVHDDTVRRARAESRLRQIARIREASASRAPKANEVAVGLLQIERLADAIAEGELRDLGLGEGPARTALAGLIDSLRES
ncbi:MAG TPA: helix-turn-helix domain-containing protein [Polyangiales bacterium]|nr:helix-turn-helix domain-containing protein [Polyangiales bacterium]